MLISSIYILFVYRLVHLWNLVTNH